MPLSHTNTGRVPRSSVRGSYTKVKNVFFIFRPSKRISQVKRQYYPGPLFGLNLLIDPLTEDYTYTTRPGQGVEVRNFLIIFKGLFFNHKLVI